MRIALMGYGKMGQIIEQMAHARGHEIVLQLSRKNKEQAHPLIQKADICIDFSHASCVLEHLHLCGEHKKNLVIGTTGWESQQEEVKRLVEKFQIGCLYAPNFAIGVVLFKQVLAYAAKLFDPFDEYEVMAWESHHRQKKDQPSGTAKSLANAVVENMNRVETLPFTCHRGGFDPGTHVISFDGPHDKMILTHESRNRESFAKGAIKAAEWMLNKKGYFTLEEMLTCN